MKTLADFKRVMKIGTRWEGYHHGFKTDFGVREVTKVQTTKFAFRTTRKDGSVVDSWMDFPKSHLIEFGSDGWVNIYDPYNRQLELSYRLVEAAVIPSSTGNVCPRMAIFDEVQRKYPTAVAQLDALEALGFELEEIAALALTKE